MKTIATLVAALLVATVASAQQINGAGATFPNLISVTNAAGAATKAIPNDFRVSITNAPGHNV